MGQQKGDTYVIHTFFNNGAVIETGGTWWKEGAKLNRYVTLRISVPSVM